MGKSLGALLSPPNEVTMKSGLNFIDRNNIKRHYENGTDPEMISKMLGIKPEVVNRYISAIAPKKRSYRKKAVEDDDETIGIDDDA